MRDGTTVAVRCTRTGIEVAGGVRVASRPWSRIRGLLGHPEPPAGAGLLIEPCNGVHTFFMRYSIDVVFLDREGAIRALRPALPSRRMVPWVRRAKRVLEFPAGTIDRADLRVGDRLALVVPGAGEG